MTKFEETTKNTAVCQDSPENNFGLPERLRRMRKRRRMSQIVLSQCCGLSKNAIAFYESGRRLPSVNSLVRLAEFFDVSADFLLGRENF